MATDPTTLPTIGDIQQAKKDMTDINTFVASEQNAFTDNTGKSRKTMEGLHSDVDELISEKTTEFAQESAEAFSEFDLTLDQYKESRGFNTKGTFAAGFTYELPNDVGLDASGNPWILIDTISLPVTVAAGTTPTNPPYKQVAYGTAAQVSTNTSDTVQSFIDSFALKIFQSPTDGGLTEIQTRTVDAGEVYEVRKTSDDSLATIYSDAAGTAEIVQNGTANKSGSDGVVEFYIAEGDYYLTSGTFRSNFANDNNADDVNRIVSGVTRKLSDSLNDFVNIKDYGAVDDYNGTTGKNCFPALQRILTEFPDYNVTIKFPNIGTGKYFFSGNLFAEDVSGLFLDVDEGVEIYFEGTYMPLISKGVKVNRELKVRILNQGYNFYLGREMYGRPSDNLIKLTQSSGEVCTPNQINPSSGQLYFKTVSWPDNTIVDDTPSTTSTTIDYVADTNAFNLAMIDAVIGGEAHCYVYAPAYDGKIGVAVLTKEGYSIIYQDAEGGTITSGYIVGAGSLVQLQKNPTFSTDAYKGVNAQIGIRVHSRRSYSLLINNIDFFKVEDTGSDILSMGFTVGFAPTVQDITLASPTLLTGKKSSGVRPLNIVCIGDSTSDENVPPSAFDFMRQYLAGVGGIQIRNLKNLAVSGENSGQQLARLLAENIAGYDYLLIDVGVNDIQGNLGAIRLNDNVTAAINFARANGVVPIVGVPTYWYEPADADPYGQVGQLSTNSDIGSQYRASLIATVASNNALLNLNTLQDLGVADPSLLAVLEADPVLMDNIHPSNLGRQLRGMGWAKSIIGHCMPAIVDSTPNETMPVSYLQGDAGATERPFIAIKDGVCTISGTISVLTITDNYQVIKLPEGLRPRRNKTIVCSTALAGGIPSGFCTIQISTSGDMRIFGVAASSEFIYVDLSFNI